MSNPKTNPNKPQSLAVRIEQAARDYLFALANWHETQSSYCFGQACELMIDSSVLARKGKNGQAAVLRNQADAYYAEHKQHEQTAVDCLSGSHRPRNWPLMAWAMNQVIEAQISEATAEFTAWADSAIQQVMGI